MHAPKAAEPLPLLEDATQNQATPCEPQPTAPLGKPPYPPEVLRNAGGRVYCSAAVNPRELHPCQRKDLCGGTDCMWRLFPKELCWDFAQKGVCGRGLCNRVHAVLSTSGEIFILTNKRVKLNAQISRSEAKAAVSQKRQRTTESKEKETEHNLAELEREKLARKVVVVKKQREFLASMTSEEMTMYAEQLLSIQ